MKFINLFIPTKEKEIVVASETWAVRWTRRFGRYYADVEKTAVFFKSKEDAEKFATQLTDAFNLIKHTSDIRVEIERIV